MLKFLLTMFRLFAFLNLTGLARDPEVPDLPPDCSDDLKIPTW
jgi:hypothetical protein